MPQNGCTFRTMKRTLSWILVSVLAALVPLGTAFALVNLGTSGGFNFDVSETGSGEVGGGTGDAYDFMYYLNVDGVDYDAAGAAATTSLGGRQYDMAEIAMGSLMVRRHVYVPATGGNWIRYLDVLRNPTGADITTTVMIQGSLGADATLEITGSSTGDIMATAADDWITTDDSSATGGDTPTGHVIQGPNGAVRASMVTVGVVGFDDIVRWQFSSVTVPAGGEVALLTFGIQENDRAATITSAELLADANCAPMGGADPLNGLDGATRSTVINFGLAGAPVACFDSVSEAPEGDPIDVTVAVTDFEGDTTLNWTWDLDGDGTYGDMADATMVTVPAGLTDGPGQFEVGIEVTDGTNTRQAVRRVNITNVDPTITSSPNREAGIRREYRYEVMVDDPAGALDPPTFSINTGPPGMAVDAAGLVTWTPEVSTRGMTFPVILTVDDGDGGEALQSWEILVSENNQPMPPEPISPVDRVYVDPTVAPTLTVMNAVDPDGDPLVYFFRLSRTSDFNSNPDVMGSGEIDEGTDMTSWTPAEPLEEGLWYWEVWVDDGIGESNRRYAQFISGEQMTAMPDAGPGTVVDGGTSDAGPDISEDGCNCTATGRPTKSGLVWLLGLAALAFFRRRR